MLFSFKKNGSIVFFLISLVVSMLCLTCASIPLYRIFCRATGYGGTTKKAINTTTSTTNQKIRVYFSADVMPDLPWEFSPEINHIDVKIGEQSLAFYYAKNLSDQPLSGMAVYNVTPFKAGKYFNKVACFCFNEQLLLSKQRTAMPVSFFIDPEIMFDHNTKNLSEITLSYTFFKLK